MPVKRPAPDADAEPGSGRGVLADGRVVRFTLDPPPPEDDEAAPDDDPTPPRKRKKR